MTLDPANTVPGVCYPPGTDWSCYGDAQKIASLDPSLRERSEALAWMTLAALTADQVGTCPITVRPCRAGCRNSDTYLTAPVGVGGQFAGATMARSGFFPHVGVNGQWVNACGCAAGDCSCSALCEAILPGPVGDILEVWLNGAVLDPTAYRVDNGNRLVRTDGECWPACQDMAQSAHGDEAFSVTYYRGAAPDVVLLWTAGILAVEWLKACENDKTCRLPRGAQNISRQGVQYEIQRSLFSEGTTGIDEVDAVIARYNPYGLKMGAHYLNAADHPPAAADDLGEVLMQGLIEDFTVYPTMVKLAACLCEEMERSGFTGLCFCGVVPGAETVLDFCGSESGSACSGDSGGCGGMAWVRLIGATPSLDQENPAAAAKCSTPLSFQIEVGMSQCAPMLGDHLEIPGLEEQLDATRRQMASMSAMRRAISCCMQDDDVDYVIDSYEPLPILGGCLASVWNLTVGEWRGAMP